MYVYLSSYDWQYCNHVDVYARCGPQSPTVIFDHGRSDVNVWPHLWITSYLSTLFSYSKKELCWSLALVCSTQTPFSVTLCVGCGACSARVGSWMFFVAFLLTHSETLSLSQSHTHNHTQSHTHSSNNWVFRKPASSMVRQRWNRNVGLWRWNRHR